MDNQKLRQKPTVIFDMDGTLIDTEKYYRVCWPQALAHFGFHMSDEQALEIRSLGRPFSKDFFLKNFGPGADYAQIREYRKKLMNEMIAEKGLQAKKGAEELLKWMQEQKIEAAVCTASDLVRTRAYLGQLGLLPFFSELISAADALQGKPAPDCYLEACRQLGKAPCECLAVEDSPNGVKSAYLAGCRVVMVPDQDEPDEETKKMLYACVPSLSDLIPLLEQETGNSESNCL